MTRCPSPLFSHRGKLLIVSILAALYGLSIGSYYYRYRDHYSERTPLGDSAQAFVDQAVGPGRGWIELGTSTHPLTANLVFDGSAEDAASLEDSLRYLLSIKPEQGDRLQVVRGPVPPSRRALLRDSVLCAVLWAGIPFLLAAYLARQRWRRQALLCRRRRWTDRARRWSRHLAALSLVLSCLAAAGDPDRWGAWLSLAWLCLTWRFVTRWRAQRPRAVTNGRQEAAILLMSLPPEVSAQIFKELGPQNVQDITVEISMLPQVPQEIRQDVCQTFQGYLDQMCEQGCGGRGCRLEDCRPDKVGAALMKFYLHAPVAGGVLSLPPRDIRPAAVLTLGLLTAAAVTLLLWWRALPGSDLGLAPQPSERLASDLAYYLRDQEAQVATIERDGVVTTAVTLAGVTRDRVSAELPLIRQRMEHVGLDPDRLTVTLVPSRTGSPWAPALAVALGLLGLKVAVSRWRRSRVTVTAPAQPVAPRPRRRVSQCPQCDEVFADADSMARHQQSHVSISASKLTKLQKAAILLMSLPPEVSAQLFKELGPEEVQNITIEISKLPQVSPEVRAQVVREFTQSHVGAQTSAGGPVEAKRVENLRHLLQVDALSLEVGRGLLSLVDPNQGAKLLERVTSIRRLLTLELGLLIPGVRFRDNLQLKPNAYVIKVNDTEVALGEVQVTKFLAVGPEDKLQRLRLPILADPTFGTPCVWIEPLQRAEAEESGCVILDPVSVIATQLTQVCRNHAGSLLTFVEAGKLMDQERLAPLMAELRGRGIDRVKVWKVLRDLLAEQVTIRDLETVLQALLETQAQDSVGLLTELARLAVRDHICRDLFDTSGVMCVRRLPEVHEATLRFARPRAEALLQWVSEAVAQLKGRKRVPILVTTPELRRALRQVTADRFPDVFVLSQAEIPPRVEVQE